MASFRQQAVDRFHALAPEIALAPGIDGAAAWLLGGGSPGDGVVAFQLPITYETGGQRVPITTAENVARAHREGYAWHTWLSDDGESVATWRTLIDQCVDGVMTARPVAFERTLRKHGAPPPAADGAPWAAQRSERKLARISSAKSCGCSQAAKWPPRSSRL